MGEFFRASVGVIVRSVATGDVAVFERRAHPGAWQYPQGGIEAGESTLDAARRELREETGLTADDVRFVGELDRWLTYELPAEHRTPKTGRGQTQRWVLVELCPGRDRAIDLAGDGHPEFCAWRWTPARAAADNAVAFRRPIYRELAGWLERLGGYG